MGFVLAIIGVQLVTGLTLSAEFRSNGRWACLVRRRDEPQLYWTIVGCQSAILGTSWLFSRV